MPIIWTFQKRTLLTCSATSKDSNYPGTAAIFRTLLSSSAFWLVCILSLGTTLLRETFNLWTPTYFTQIVGMTNAQAASGSALFPLFGGLSVLLAGFLSDALGAEGRSRILFAGLSLCVLALLGLAHVPMHASQLLSLALVSAVAFLLIGPYSYLAGAISLDFGGKEGSATASASSMVSGYLAGVLSGNSMAHIAVTLGGQDDVPRAGRRRRIIQRCRGPCTLATTPARGQHHCATRGGSMTPQIITDQILISYQHLHTKKVEP